MKTMYTVQELAERWEVSEYTIRKMIKDGTLVTARLPVLKVSYDEIRRHEVHGAFRDIPDIVAITERIEYLEKENTRLKEWRAKVINAVGSV